jgi:hypothetical protein
LSSVIAFETATNKSNTSIDEKLFSNRSKSLRTSKTKGLKQTHNCFFVSLRRIILLVSLFFVDLTSLVQKSERVFVDGKEGGVGDDSTHQTRRDSAKKRSCSSLSVHLARTVLNTKHNSTFLVVFFPPLSYHCSLVATLCRIRVIRLHGALDHINLNDTNSHKLAKTRTRQTPSFSTHRIGGHPVRNSARASCQHHLLKQGHFKTKTKPQKLLTLKPARMPVPTFSVPAWSAPHEPIRTFRSRIRLLHQMIQHHTTFFLSFTSHQCCFE